MTSATLAGLVAVVVLTMTACSGSDCDGFPVISYRVQTFPHPSAQAALDDFLGSEMALEADVSGSFRFDSLKRRTASTAEVAIFKAVEGTTMEIVVQHGEPGWAVGGVERCR